MFGLGLLLFTFQIKWRFFCAHRRVRVRELSANNCFEDILNLTNFLHTFECARCSNNDNKIA